MVLAEILLIFHIVTRHKIKNIVEKKTVENAKITKRCQAYIGYVSTCNVKTLNFLSSELQLNCITSAIINKKIHFLTKLKIFKFVTTLVLELEK